ncbi:MAG: MopE-related protein [Myxococcota bacterium]|nr:MopE-related protein [Myxococcota bacterium]
MLLLLSLLACKDGEPVVDDSAPVETPDCELPPNLTTSPDEDCFGYPDATDCDCDGYVKDSEDCDDRNSYTFPGADDIPYNGVDDDCAGDGDLVDWDGDGYDSVQVGGDDCNDGNAQIYPGAPETCYNGIDEDCSGDDDSNDCDGDGFPGIGDDKTDCDDTDPERNPAADEIWYDGVDQNCSGQDSDYDADGDGDDSADHPNADGDVGTDCDDSDPLTAGGNPELLDNQDRDCDGVVDLLNSRDGQAWWYGALGSGDGFLGISAAVMEDYDGDGSLSIAVGGHGSASETDPYIGYVYLLDVSSGQGKPQDLAHTLIYGGVGYDLIGTDLANVGDMNGDGHPELLVGAPEAGSSLGHAYLFDGADIAAGGTLSPSDALSTLGGGAAYAGADVGSVQDLDGDGVPELFLGTGFWSAVGSTPQIVVYSGSDALDGDLSTIDALAQVDVSNNDGGDALSIDLDGDGLQEVLFPAYTADPGQGVLAVMWGDEVATMGAVSIDDLDWIRGESLDRIGYTTGWYDDMDGDGYPELLVRSYGADGNAGGGGGGRIYLVDSDVVTRGQGTDVRIASQAFGTIEGTVDSGHVKTPTEQGDYDGDGVDDILVMHPGDREHVNPLVGEGAAVRPTGYILQVDDVSGGGSVSADLRADEHLLDGFKDDELSGFSLIAADFDGDGVDDIYFGSPGAGGKSTSRAGNAHVFLSYLDGDYSDL